MTFGARLKRLLIDKVGALRCGGRHGHDWSLMFHRQRWFLRCANCGAETQGFVIGLPKDPRRI